MVSKPMFIALLGIAAMLAGCASGPTTYEIRGNADPILNRDYSGQSLSVVVRVYQLKDPAEFSKLTFDMLATGRADSELFGPELIGKTEAIVVPGRQYSSPDKLAGEAKYVGVVAMFRTPDQHYWRYLVSADEIRSKGLNFAVKDCYITLNNLKPYPIPGQPLDAKPACTNASANLRRQAAPADNSTAANNSGNTKAGTQAQNNSYKPKVQYNPATNEVNVSATGVPLNVSGNTSGISKINLGGGQ